MRTRIGISLAALTAFGLQGCATPEGSAARPIRPPTEFASRRFPNVSLEQAEAVVERVFRGHFRVDIEASTLRRLVSHPREVEGRGEPQSIGDRVRLTPARQRELAELRIDPQQGGVLVQVHVASQRLETTERATFSRGRGDDRPNTTAIDRAGPASVDVREEWRTVGRNRRTEQSILNEIQAALVMATQPAAGS